jgi:hypothetical protein|tara:strand:+ start:451 stop:2235 length:1785 start_codon:yes stop_codon:yes gene_type:complete
MLNNQAQRTKNIALLGFVPLVVWGGFFVLLSPAQAATLGEQVIFNVDTEYDISGRSQIPAILKVIGESVYFYIEEEYWNKLNITQKSLIIEELKDLTNEFDTVIYPRERAVFGSEWNPGIDNDKRITVLVSQLVDEVGGYVNIYDEYSKSEISNSNEREMIYLNVLAVFHQNNKAFLAHEFQHLISFYQKTILYGLEEDIWLNEARSEYAPTVAGYNDNYTDSYLAERVDSFLDNPNDPLGEWKNEVPDYGSVNSFIHYLAGRYGDDIFTRMVLNNKVGIDSINAALDNLGYAESFSDIFADWAVASYLNDCELSDQYCYLDDNLTHQRLHVDPSVSYSGFPNLIVSRSSFVKDWSPRWYRFRQGTAQTTDKDTLKLEFNGSTGRGDFRVPYIVLGEHSQTTVQSIKLDDQQQGIAYIPNFTSLNKSVIMIPFNQYQKNRFDDNEPSVSFSFTASSVSADEAPIIDESLPDNSVIGKYPEGSLLRAQGDYRVYIIKGEYKRWVQSYEIFNQYGHLNWEDIIDIPASELAQYQTAWLIRADGDKKVYEVNADGTKHWLNMTAEQFNTSGRIWDMVYLVNSFERDFYETGSDVLYQ